MTRPSSPSTNIKKTAQNQNQTFGEDVNDPVTSLLSPFLRFGSVLGVVVLGYMEIHPKRFLLFFHQPTLVFLEGIFSYPIRRTASNPSATDGAKGEDDSPLVPLS